jgi:hypothetical protein
MRGRMNQIFTRNYYFYRMAKNKTTENTESVAEFLNSVADETKRNDCFKIVTIIEKHTKMKAKMWGSAIVGFGTYHYKYESGREGDAPVVGFSPRKDAISLYMGCDADTKEKYLKQLGKHKAGKGCIYIKKLEDINTDVLKKMVDNSISYYKKLYP